MPFAAGAHSEPEPALALVAISDEWRRRHPDRATLIVEVARTSLGIDRQKTAIYAQVGVAEVWLIDLVGEAVEVYTEPSGGGYRRMLRFGRGAVLVPAAFPDVAIGVDALLP